MKFYVVLHKEEGQEFVDVFSNTKLAKAHLKANFNGYGKVGGDLVVMDAEQMTELVKTTAVIKFY